MLFLLLCFSSTVSVSSFLGSSILVSSSTVSSLLLVLLTTLHILLLLPPQKLQLRELSHVKERVGKLRKISLVDSTDLRVCASVLLDVDCVVLVVNALFSIHGVS